MMARRTVVTYYSDLSGAEIDSQGVGVPFSLDGHAFEIDLSAIEHSALREALGPFIAVAREVTSGTQSHRDAGTKAPRAGEPDARTLRQWALENGFDVPSRGRVPELVREAFKAAHAQRDVAAIDHRLAPASQTR